MSVALSASARAATARWAAPVAERWRALSARDRIAAAVAGAVLGLFALWSVAIAPAWQVVVQAPARLAALDAQGRDMRRLADEAKVLRAQAVPTPAETEAALQAATQRLGERGRLSLQAGRAVLTVRQVHGEQLRAWLAEARSGARIRVVDAQLTRNPDGYAGTIVVVYGAQT